VTAPVSARQNAISCAQETYNFHVFGQSKKKLLLGPNMNVISGMVASFLRRLSWSTDRGPKKPWRR
jgi:hypothetical protein